MFTFQNGIEEELRNDTEVGHRSRLFQSEGEVLGATLEHDRLQKKVYCRGGPEDDSGGDKVNIYTQIYIFTVELMGECN